MSVQKPDNFNPKKDFPDGHIHYGKKRCQSWSPRKKRQCMGLDMGNGRCRVHGGKSLSGISHPNYKTGKYVKSLPRRYFENYENALRDPNYLKLSNEIALLDSRLSELISQIDNKTSSTIFGELVSKVNKMEKAQAIIVRSQNIQDEDQRKLVQEKANIDFLESVADIARLSKSGAKEWYIWSDITDLIEKRRRLVETERRLLIDMQMLINTQDVMVLLDAVMESVRRNVTNRNIRQSIQADFIRLTTR